MRNTLRNRKANDGFTLLELLIVIAIIGILETVLIPNLLNARRNATNTAAETYGRNVVNWVASTHSSNPKLARGAAIGTCIADPLLTDEGAPAALPTAVADCAITVRADSEYTVTVESATGTGGPAGTGVYTI